MFLCFSVCTNTQLEIKGPARTSCNLCILRSKTESLEDHQPDCSLQFHWKYPLAFLSETELSLLWSPNKKHFIKLLKPQYYRGVFLLFWYESSLSQTATAESLSANLITIEWSFFRLYRAFLSSLVKVLNYGFRILAFIYLFIYSFDSLID